MPSNKVVRIVRVCVLVDAEIIHAYDPHLVRCSKANENVGIPTPSALSAAAQIGA